jgi:PAS domain S-box-containing protein
MNSPLSVLIVEDLEEDAILIARELRQHGFDLNYARVDTVQAMTAALESQQWDVIVSDYSMPNFSALDALKLARNTDKDIPFIIISGSVGEDAVAAAMKAGAHDFLSKSKLPRLVPAIERELREADERRKWRLAEEALRNSEERFRLLLESAPAALIIVDDLGSMLLVNAHTETIFGYPRSELLGQSIDILLPERFGEIHQSHRADYMTAPTARLMGVGRELWGRRKDGSEFPIEVGLNAVETSQGMIVACNVTDISPRRKVEEQLRYQAALIANVSEAVISTDMEGIILSWNPVAESMYGWVADEVVGQSTAILQTEYPDGSEEEARNQLIEYGQWKGEVIQRRSDGAPIHMMASVSFVTDASGQNIGMVTVNRDITARKRAEEALRLSEERFSRAFHQSPVGVALNASDGTFTDMNETFLEFFGYSREEVIGRTSLELNLWADPGERAEVGRLTGGGQPVRDIEIQFRRKSGDLCYGLCSFAVINVGDQMNFLSMFHDITDRKRAEEALLISEERFRNIAGLISDYAFSYRVESNKSITREWITGESFARITGFTVEEFELRQFFTLYHPEDVEAARRDVDEVIQGRSTRGEYRILTKSGDLRWLNIYREPVWNAHQNRVVRFYGVAQDITERIRLEQEQLEGERMRVEFEKERELIDLKERFISVVSHDLRTPLAVIMSSAEIIERYHDRLTVERQMEHLRKIQRQANGMAGMMQEILTLSKARAGKMDFNPATMDVENFCRQLFDQIVLTSKSAHDFVFKVISPVGDAMLDEKLLQHILLNLLTNAVKYSPQEGEVRFELWEQGESLYFRISDQGIGIPQDELERLFEPFHRAKNVGDISGTGLGMAIAKESVDRHGGTIECQSEIGVGTTVTVTLPLTPA